MHVKTTVAFATLLASSIAVILLEARPPGASEKATPPVAAASALPIVDAGQPPDRRAPQTEAGPELEDAGASSSGYATLPDGATAPPLPSDAPKSVEFGAILVTYRGAQGAPKDAPSKEDAYKRARKLLKEALEDFAGTVNKGDPGSNASAGRLPRGILEPAPEYILFSLEKDQVYPQPVDTPRGYWILRRTK